MVEMKSSHPWVAKIEFASMGKIIIIIIIIIIMALTKFVAHGWLRPNLVA
jgi:hypothetical protein